MKEIAHARDLPSRILAGKGDRLREGFRTRHVVDTPTGDFRVVRWLQLMSQEHASAS